MPKTSLDKVRSLVNYLDLQGMERKTILAKVALTEQQLNSSNELIDTTDYEQLFQLAEEQLNTKMIGFEFGQAIEPDRWGVLGYIVYTSPSLQSALKSQYEYQSLAGNVGVPLHEIKDNSITLMWAPSYLCSYHTVEEVITSWVVIAKKLTNYSATPLKIYFNHSCPSQVDIYQDFFGCEVEFDSPINGIKISRSVLELPLVKYSPELNTMLCEQASRVVNNLIQQLPVQVVTQFITNQLPMGVPEVESAAQYVQMSVRTLQRKLNEHELTYSGLVDSIRKELAQSYLLKTDSKIVRISQMLGFSEQSAFQRAFKRWTGKTPKSFRDCQ